MNNSRKLQEPKTRHEENKWQKQKCSKSREAKGENLFTCVHFAF